MIPLADLCESRFSAGPCRSREPVVEAALRHGRTGILMIKRSRQGFQKTAIPSGTEFRRSRNRWCRLLALPPATVLLSLRDKAETFAGVSFRTDRTDGTTRTSGCHRFYQSDPSHLGPDGNSLRRPRRYPPALLLPALLVLVLAGAGGLRGHRDSLFLLHL